MSRVRRGNSGSTINLTTLHAPDGKCVIIDFAAFLLLGQLLLVKHGLGLQDVLNRVPDSKRKFSTGITAFKYIYHSISIYSNVMSVRF